MKSQLIQAFRAAYGRDPEIITRAPGRAEFIGNHTDYNGGTVLGAALDRGLWVGLSSRADGQWRFASETGGPVVQVAAGAPQPQAGAGSWCNYPLGVIAAFPKFGLNLPGGFDLMVVSDLPTGAGLSSSAALELSSALAFLRLSGQEAPRETVVKIGRHAENNFVGVPCGILDQGVSGFGERDHLVYIDCRGPSFRRVPLPDGAHFWVFNTHTRHALVDGFYAARHRECMEAAQLLGAAVLADVSAAAVEAARAALPAAVYRRAKHVVEEIARVEETVQALQAGDLAAAGALLTASHRSSQHLFENSTPELDFLVDELSRTPEVYGARLTGGGFGGAVLALTSERFTPSQAQRVAEAYAGKYGAAPDILHTRTGPGAEVVTG